MTISPGLSATREHTVTTDDTAQTVGSGSLPVLGTPVLLAWCESVTCAAVEEALETGQTTVGVHVDVEHLAPSAVGAIVEVGAAVTEVDARSVTFEVSAHQPSGAVARGKIVRAVVDVERFLARLDR